MASARQRVAFAYTSPINLDFFQELKNLTDAFESSAIEYALCGGVALAIHGVLKLAAGRPQDLVDVQRLQEAGRG